MRVACGTCKEDDTRTWPLQPHIRHQHAIGTSPDIKADEAPASLGLHTNG